MLKEKLMALLQVLKGRLRRKRDRLNDLETLVNRGVASSNQKQEFVELRARIDEIENMIDLTEGMLEIDNGKSTE